MTREQVEFILKGLESVGRVCRETGSYPSMAYAIVFGEDLSGYRLAVWANENQNGKWLLSVDITHDMESPRHTFTGVMDFTACVSRLYDSIILFRGLNNVPTL